MVHFAGWTALGYLFLSSAFAIGLHPVGARWIQEHYLTFPGNQETFSYYGPMNVFALNVGYHNEHHDLMRVPWSRLPALKAHGAGALRAAPLPPLLVGAALALPHRSRGSRSTAGSSGRARAGTGRLEPTA